MLINKSQTFAIRITAILFFFSNIFIILILPQKDIRPFLLLLLITIFLIIIRVFFYQKLLRINIINLFLYIFLLFLVVLSNNFKAIFLWSYVFLFYCAYNFYSMILWKKEIKYINFILFTLIIISFIYQFSTYKNFDGRHVLSVIDPNSSGIYVMMFFMLSNIYKFRLGIILSFIFALLLMSRALILGIFIFYFIKILKKIKLIDYLISPGKLLILGNIFILVLSFVWISHISLEEVRDDSRINLVDASNTQRFGANIRWFGELINNKELLFNGIEIDETKTVPPHNSLIRLFCDYGIIPSIIYLTLVMIFFDKVNVKNNKEYLSMYFFYSFFLHGLYSSIYFILFYYLLLINSKRL